MWPANLILAYINHILKAEKLFSRRLTFFLSFLFDTFSIELKTENGYKISEKYVTHPFYMEDWMLYAKE